MKAHRFSLIIPAFLITFSVSAETPLTTDKDKFSYGLGMIIGERVLKQYGEVDYEILLRGIVAQHQGKQTLMSMTEAGQALNASKQKLNEQKFGAVMEKGKAYLAENAKLDGVTVTKSGLQYSIITTADGAKPAATDL
jgi:FKBP-type peptidyl-prolyl cis-trans isomerase